jgi:hypothetical protein
MRRQRNRISIVILAIACGSAFAPAGASAGSLLSGYGGPGQGSQQILGATLLNGPSGGGGAGGEGAAGSSPAGAGGSALMGDAGRVGAGGLQRRSPAHRLSGRHGGNGAQTASSSDSRAQGAVAVRGASQTDTVGAQTLGLSEDDLVYIFLTLGALALTGALSRQLARRPRQGS